MKINYLMYYILQWTWGILQNVLGLCIFLLNIKRKHFIYHGAVVTIWKCPESSMGLGMFIFQSEKALKEKENKFTEEEAQRMTRVHEYGHTLQSIILGPLFLLVIGIPSMAWAKIPCFKRYRAEKDVSYFSFYTEKWANSLGEYATKEKSMGQAKLIY